MVIQLEDVSNPDRRRETGGPSREGTGSFSIASRIFQATQIDRSRSLRDSLGQFYPPALCHQVILPGKGVGPRVTEDLKGDRIDLPVSRFDVDDVTTATMGRLKRGSYETPRRTEQVAQRLAGSPPQHPRLPPATRSTPATRRTPATQEVSRLFWLIRWRSSFSSSERDSIPSRLTLVNNWSRRFSSARSRLS